MVLNVLRIVHNVYVSHMKNSTGSCINAYTASSNVIYRRNTAMLVKPLH